MPIIELTDWCVVQVFTVAKFLRPSNPRRCNPQRYHVWRWRGGPNAPAGLKCLCGLLSDPPAAKTAERSGRVVTCPTCGTAFGSTVDLTDPPRTPRAGDVGLCEQCGEALYVQPDLTVRVASDRDIAPGNRRMVYAAQRVIRRKEREAR